VTSLRTADGTETGRFHPSWITIGVFAVVIAAIDGFWVTSLQGAVGAIERTQGPFAHWLRYSALMIPLLGLAVIAALRLARRWDKPHRRQSVRLAITALLVVVVTTLVSIGEVVANSVYDYHLQSRQLGLMHALHTLPTVGQSGPACNALCLARQQTFDVHVRAITMGGLVLLVTNVVVVAFLLIFRSDRLWIQRASPSNNPRSNRSGRPCWSEPRPFGAEIRCRAGGAHVHEDGPDGDAQDQRHV
jgi:hypothetical protein